MQSAYIRKSITVNSNDTRKNWDKDCEKLQVDGKQRSERAGWCLQKADCTAEWPMNQQAMEE